MPVAWFQALPNVDNKARAPILFISKETHLIEA
jgi:hypothetical protein